MTHSMNIYGDKKTRKKHYISLRWLLVRNPGMKKIEKTLEDGFPPSN